MHISDMSRWNISVKKSFSHSFSFDGNFFSSRYCAEEKQHSIQPFLFKYEFFTMWVSFFSFLISLHSISFHYDDMVLLLLLLLMVLSIRYRFDESKKYSENKNAIWATVRTEEYSNCVMSKWLLSKWDLFRHNFSWIFGVTQLN